MKFTLFIITVVILAAWPVASKGAGLRVDCPAGYDIGGDNASKDCTSPPATGKCRVFVPMYFYNSTSGICEEFIYGGCGGNCNRYVSEYDCRDACIQSTPRLGSPQGYLVPSLPYYGTYMRGDTSLGVWSLE